MATKLPLQVMTLEVAHLCDSSSAIQARLAKFFWCSDRTELYVLQAQ